MLTRVGPAAAFAVSNWRETLVAEAANASAASGKHCVILWMAGGPSQTDTFDMKPGTKVGGPFKEIQTNVSGVRFSEHFPELAKQADRLAIVRSVTTKEGDHQRGTMLMHTGNMVGGAVQYPSIGSALSKSLQNTSNPLPAYVAVATPSIAPQSQGPGFLGPRYAPAKVSANANDTESEYASLRVDYMNPGMQIESNRYHKRSELWTQQQTRFLKRRNLPNVLAQDTAYQSAMNMIASDAKEAFELSQEPEHIRDAYGKGTFGQGCLLARRLIERDVPVVEVALGDGLGWDTHTDNFDRVKELSGQLDRGWATLMSELQDRGLLENTTILWAGEFGRTPTINRNGGRDHFPQAFSCVLAGGGISGGQVYGETASDGSEVTDRPVEAKDLTATLCAAVGIKPSTENMTEGGRPIKISEGSKIDEVLL
ncbi:DUF1501 domain-containing protein [Stieleria sp. JC731]|uniref:DUF1501 domain-containing protein n=1 Tax=Pirellulaceae TaxID=2691357 RepID=UPI001E5C8272|nr:DUF1501 domain-containing protein [Stieleria sp. JC731]